MRVNLKENEVILVLGASSWLGYLIVKKLVDSGFRGQIIGTYYSRPVNFNGLAKIVRTSNSEDILGLINAKKPTIIINLLRGETEIDFLLHQELSKLSKKYNSFYVYASSVLALDGYTDVPLTESLNGKSISTYGIFKVRCENVFNASDSNWCVLRFASIQGWVPHKVTRNEAFLKKLSKGEQVLVDRGVIQNRILASLLAEGVIDIISERVCGIVHFGANDCSEELVFLRRQAEAFGYEKNLVIAGNERNVNLVAVPGKIHSLFGLKYYVSEADTLRGLLDIEGLKQYLKHGTH